MSISAQTATANSQSLLPSIYPKYILCVTGICYSFLFKRSGYEKRNSIPGNCAVVGIVVVGIVVVGIVCVVVGIVVVGIVCVAVGIVSVAGGIVCVVVVVASGTVVVVSKTRSNCLFLL